MKLEPDVIVVMLCGFGVARAREELAALDDDGARALLAGAPVWVLDGNAYSRVPARAWWMEPNDCRPR